MKLAFFYRQLGQGGIQRMIVNCSNYFVSKGHDVSVILIKQGGEYHELLDKNIKVIYFPSTRQINLIASLSTILKSEKFDLLYTATPELNTFAIITKLITRTRTKIVISERNNTVVFFKKMKFSLSKLAFLSIPLLYRFADQIIAVSEGLAAKLSQVALVSPEKIKAIYNPAYSSLLEEQLRNVISYDWFNDNEKIPVIVTVGRLTHAKNHSLLIEAIAVMLKMRKVRLLIIGDGILKTGLQNLIDSKGLSQSIRLLGFKIDPAAWIKHSDLFVLSSDYEGFGNVLVEALAAGCTIVSTDCEYGPGEILANGNGYLVPTGDILKLASMINFALDNKLPEDQLISRAKDFSVESIMTQYEKVFNDVLGESSKNRLNHAKDEAKVRQL